MGIITLFINMIYVSLFLFIFFFFFWNNIILILFISLLGRKKWKRIKLNKDLEQKVWPIARYGHSAVGMIIKYMYFYIIMF